LSVQGSPSLTERLAAHCARPVDAAARARARLHLLDWLGCVAGALRGEMGAIARLGHRDRLRGAALLGSVLEMDDVDRLGRVHPGPVIWPAALMEARYRGGVDMATLLDAGVRGVEGTVAVARLFDDRHYAFFHPTHSAGRFGAVIASASLAKLAPAETVHALGIGGSTAGAVWQVRHEPANSKAYHVADAVLGGLYAVDLAAAGMTGPRFVLEGPQGLFAAMGGDAARWPERQGWLISELSFKPWAACRHAHPAIDAALALPDGALAAGPIHVESYVDALTFCDRPAPRTPSEAKFSLQHAVAVVAVRGRPQLADFEPEAIADPDIAAARARVTVAEAPNLTARYPAHFGARVTAGGAVAEVGDALGDPENPVDRAAIIAKLRALVAWGGLSEDDADKAIMMTLRSGDSDRSQPIVELVESWLA
jgi:2-methylcitrate dehydratase PrpD